MKYVYKQQTKGFTLIELLVVIAIIGLLSSIVLASLNTARRKARDAKRLADLKQINLALQLYYNDNNTYPAFYGDDRRSNWSNLENALSPYIPKLPHDPIGEGDSESSYYYAYFKITSNWWGNGSCTGFNVLYAYPTDNTLIHQECSPSAPITIVVGETP